MTPLPPGTRIYLACQPIDMRKGMYSLAAEVSAMLHADPYSGQVFVFRGRSGDYVKILHWDGTGLCLFAKRLEAGRFVWPPVVHEQLCLTPAQLALLLEGIDWRRTVQNAVVFRPSAA